MGAYVQDLLNCIFEYSTDSIDSRLKAINESKLPEEIKFDAAKIISLKNKVQEFLTPRLVTPIKHPFTNTLGELIYAISKRNLNPPKISLIMEPKIAEDVVENFLKYILMKKIMNQVNQFLII